MKILLKNVVQFLCQETKNPFFQMRLFISSFLAAQVRWLFWAIYLGSWKDFIETTWDNLSSQRVQAALNLFAHERELLFISQSIFS